MQRQLSNKATTRRERQQKQSSLTGNYSDRRPPTKSSHQISQRDRTIKQNHPEEKNFLYYQKKQLKKQTQNKFSESQIHKANQNSININIKSNTKQLIESKEYKSKFVNQFTPVFPTMNQEESFQIQGEEKHQRHQNRQKHQRHQNRQKHQRHQNRQNKQKNKNENYVDYIKQAQIPMVSGDYLFSQTRNKNECSLEDVQKLSKIFCEIMLKEDTKKIKKLNSTNQELKSICKQIVSILRKDSNNLKGKKCDELIVKQIYGVILKHEKKKGG